MDENKQPGIKFDNILLAREKFSRIPEITNEKLNITLRFKMAFNKAEDTYSNEITTELVCLSNEGKAYVNLEFTYVGNFSVQKDAANMDIDDFMKHNSPALIFPYIREHISMITQKAGIKPIILPPMNILAMTSDIQSNI